MKKKCLAIADLHGYLPELESDIDYLFIAGDLSPRKLEKKERMRDWLENEFFEWTRQFKRVILVAGNHDFFFYNKDTTIDFPDNVTYLRNSSWCDENIHVYGTPQCSPFGTWAFMDAPKFQKDMYDDFGGFKEDRLSIILSHDAPYGCSDIITAESPYANGQHIGNKVLAELIERTVPKLVLHGHLHSANHDVEYMNDGETEVFCVSILGEDYNPTYKPFKFFIKC